MAQTIELILDATNANGAGVGTNPANGKRVLVADTMPGERVEVELIEDQHNWQRGRLLRVLEASPDRITPPCPYFGPPQPVTLPDGSQLNPAGELRCAGCLWQHIAYDAQLAQKRANVVAQLARGSLFNEDGAQNRAHVESLVAEVVALGDPTQEEDVALAYRFLTQMTFQLNEQGQLCLPARVDEDSTAAVLPIAFCLLHHSQLADLFAAMAVDEETGGLLARELLSVEMTVGATANQVSDGHEGVIVMESRSGEAPLLELDLPVNVLLRRANTEEVADVELLIGDWSYPVAMGDSQYVAYPAMGGAPLVHPHISGDESIGTLALALLEIQPFEHVVHLGAGAGLISLIIAGQAAAVIAVEEEDLAIAALEANIAGVDNIAVHGGPIRRMLDELRRGSYETHVALITLRNEPTDEVIFRHLDRLGILRLVLVCEEISELAQAVPLARAERFELAAVQPIDLHPQRPAVTLIARFDRIR